MLVPGVVHRNKTLELAILLQPDPAAMSAYPPYVWQRLLEVALSPVLIPQALYVRRRVEKLPEAAGERTGSAGQGPSVRVLIIGDSAAAGVGVTLQEQALSGQLARALSADHQLHWQLLARTGATTLSTTQALREQPQQAFDYALVSLGVNDATRGVGPRRWPTQLQQLQTVLRERFGVRHAWYAALPPMHRFPALPQPMRSLLGGRARALDQALLHWCEAGADRSRLQLELPIEPAHMARDGFHPGASVYTRWGSHAAECIRAHLRSG